MTIRCVLIICFTLTAGAESLKLPAIFSDHMMLQADKRCEIRGFARPDAKVSISWNKKLITTVKSDANGSWQTKLPSFQSGKSGSLTITDGKETVVINDVIVGEVWLASGQSNMWMPVKPQTGYPGVTNWKSELKNANYPDIRFFMVTRCSKHKPDIFGRGTWTKCTPETAAIFSAAAFFFGRELHHKLKKPVGLISASYGGTPISAWISSGTLQKEEAVKPLLQQWKVKLAEWEAGGKERYRKAFSEYKAGKIKRPYRYYYPNGHHLPSGLFNGMIAALAGFKIRGVLWYHGEHNVPRAVQYRQLLPALINDWRNYFHEPKLPFLLVQLTGFRKRSHIPSVSAWAELREAQALTAEKLPFVEYAVTFDHGSNHIHAPEKQPIGHRLALLAINKIYGESIECNGPQLQNFKIIGDKIHLYFDRPLFNHPVNSQIKGLVISDKKQKFFPAESTIKNNELIVWNKQVKVPEAVRYAWADNSDGNLTGSNQLPVAPFRTDNYPLSTENKYYTETEF